jgi:hypothetical protein
MIDYQVHIKNENPRIEKWTWFGELDSDGNKILRNFHLYSSDTMLKIDNNNEVVGGYSFIFNSVNTLNVTEVKI